MNKPKVSVIMPVYNAEKYISWAVESILNQSFKNFELVVVDDCGNDNSMNILSRYKDSRIKIYHNTANRGIAFSRNRAISESTGEYIAIMDDDDIALKDRLLHQSEFLDSNPVIDVVGGQSSIINEIGEVVQPPEMMQENYKMNKVMFLFYNSFHNSEVMFRKRLVEQNNIIYADNMLGMEDFKFWIDCSANGFISNINEEVLRYRRTESNETSRVRNSQYEDRKRLFNKLRRYSLERNGYSLQEEELAALNKVINEEGDGTFHSADEVMKLFRCMYSIIGQAKQLRVDYLNELQMWLKIIFNNKFSDSYHEDIWL